MDTSNRPEDEVISRLAYVLGDHRIDCKDLTPEEWLIIIKKLLTSIHCKYLSNFKPYAEDELTRVWLRDNEFRVILPDALSFCAEFQRSTRFQYVTSMDVPYGIEISQFKKIPRDRHCSARLFLTQEGKLIQQLMIYYHGTEVTHASGSSNNHGDVRRIEYVQTFEFTLVTEEILLWLLQNNNHFAECLFSGLVGIIHKTILDREFHIEQMKKTKTEALEVARRMKLYVHLPDRFPR